MMVHITKQSSHILDSSNKLYHPKWAIIWSELGKIKQSNETGKKKTELSITFWLKHATALLPPLLYPLSL